MSKKTKFILLAGIVVLAALGILVILQRLTPISVEKELTPPTEVTTPTEITTPTEEITATPTEEETVTPKIPGLSSCVMLDEEYCKKGELMYNESLGALYIGFNLPIGTKIYAPREGLWTDAGTTFLKATEGTPSVFLMTPPLENGVEFDFIGVDPNPKLLEEREECVKTKCDKVPLDEYGNWLGLKINRGKVIGIVAGSRIDTGEVFKKTDHTLMITIGRGNLLTHQNYKIAMDILSEYFPYIPLNE